MWRYTMKTLLLLICLILCGACEIVPTYETDQELRHKIFMECLDKIPEGPEQTKYNDWDEVVKAYDSVAYYQSQKKVYKK